MTDFPSDAMSFYRELEQSNTREFWEANKTRYEGKVRAPLVAIAELLAPEFGGYKLFRPHRDVRFSADKAPYKTHQGVFFQTAPACGFYLEVNSSEARGVAGFYAATPVALARIRRAVADDEEGPRIQALLRPLLGDGWLVTGDQVATAPRGYPRDHPRIELLRHKSLAVEREVSSEGVASFAPEVAEAWRAAAPLVDWFAQRLRE